MRGLLWLGLLVAALLSAGPLHAFDIPPGAAIPDSTIRTDTATPSSQADIQPTPTPPAPQGQMPSPIAPSEKPTGYVAPPVSEVPWVPGNFIEVNADAVRTGFENGKPTLTTAEGHVTAKYKDITITANHATVDYATNLAVFDSNVVFRIGVEEAYGQRVTLNLNTREWTGLGAFTTITPEFAKGYLRAPIFAKGRQIEGIGTRQIGVFDAEATTCNLTTPHYDFVAKSVVVFPNNKAVFRRVTMYVLGRKIFTLPRLVIPLRDIEKNPNLIPRVGQSVEEGYFLKTAYNLTGSKSNATFLLLDMMTKKGIGKGFHNLYEYGKAKGNIYFYQIFDKNIQENTLTGRANHTQQLGTVLLNASTDFRSDSYLYAPQSQSIINQVTLTRDRLGANTTLVVNENVNDSFSRSSRLAGNLKHRQLFGKTTSLATVFDYTAFSTKNTQARLTSQLAFDRKEPKFDWNISAQKLTDMSDEAFVGRGLFGGIERLPEVGIVSDTARLGSFLPFKIPARMKLTYGDYAELPASINRNRTYFEMNTPVRKYDLPGKWMLGAGAGFRQYFYSDDTAQYAVDTSAELVKTLGPKSSFGLTYRYQRPKGFTPFRFDFVGRYNTANASLNLQDSRRFRLAIITGYNFDQHDFPWQDAVLRMSLEPSPSLLLYTATGYDLNRSVWRTLINQVRVRNGEAFKLDIGTRYDTVSKHLAEVRTVLDTRLTDKWRIEGNAGYNGFTKQFDYQGLKLTRDLHCWEASLIYINQSGFYHNQSLMFNLRIKAFPYFTDFGAGAFGQTLDTSVGQVY